MLLAIDTASRFMSLALHDGYTLVAEQTHYTNNQHTEQLSVSIQRLLQGCALSVKELSVLAISQGPGSFSGLRVGFGVAKGLATARRLPMVPIPTFDILVAGIPRSKSSLIAVVQAGRGRVIAGHHRWSKEHWQAHGTPEIVDWQTLINTITKETLIAGEIDEQGRHLLAEQPSINILTAPWNIRRAGILAQLGWEAYQSGESINDPAAVNPIYLKEAG